jgi:hypothetical protein
MEVQGITITIMGMYCAHSIFQGLKYWNFVHSKASNHTRYEGAAQEVLEQVNIFLTINILLIIMSEQFLDYTHYSFWMYF